MSDVPVQLVVAAFDDDKGANEALRQLKEFKKEKLIGIQGAVLMVKDATGQKIQYKEVGLTPAKGALGGVVLGAALGILTGGAGIILGAGGALLGGLVGRKKQDSRFASDRINQVASSLKPGASALVAVVEHKWVADLEKELEEMGGDLLTAPISSDIARELEEHHEVAYSVLLNELKQAAEPPPFGDQPEVANDL
jgi:uncharacterized membrane protein